MLKYYISILVLIVASGMVSTARSQNDLAEVIILEVGKSKIIGDNNFRIGFDSILSDSRCPEDALCFWEGDATAQFWADQSPGDNFFFELHSHRGFQWQIIYNDYQIALIDVVPYPRTDREIDPDEYIVILTVTEIHASTEHTTWSRIKALFN